MKYRTDKLLEVCYIWLVALVQIWPILRFTWTSSMKDIVNNTGEVWNAFWEPDTKKWISRRQENHCKSTLMLTGGGDKTDLKSYSRYIMLLSPISASLLTAGTPISWSSKKHSTTAMPFHQSTWVCVTSPRKSFGLITWSKKYVVH